VRLKRNAYRMSPASQFTGTASARFQPLSVSTVRSGVMGTNMHGTIQRRQQIDAAYFAAYLTVVAIAAIVILIHPKPELLPLSLWLAGHPL
jgi:LytS/YehU family sensor histidine kinase